MAAQTALPPISDEPVRFTCAGCGEGAISRDTAWVERVKQIHHCPTPEDIENALKGRYDG